MYVGYYVQDRFPLLQNQGGPFNAFPGSPYVCARSQSKADTLGYYRPNQALNRVYMRGMGSINFSDPTTLLGLGAAGLAAWWLFKGKRRRANRRRRRL